MKHVMHKYILTTVLCLGFFGVCSPINAQAHDPSDRALLEQFLAVYSEKAARTNREMVDELSQIRNFGSWAISENLYQYILDLLPEGSTILELGSGWGTGELAKKYTMYSIENDRAWVGKYNSHYIHAPIVNRWYDIEVLKRELPLINYDLILIDGPLGTIGRIGFLYNIDLFNTHVPMIFDDVQRKQELELLKKVSVHLGRPYQIITNKEKSFGVILPS